MTNLTDLASAAVTQLQLVVASGTVIDLTNQRDSDGTVDTTVLTAVCNQAARRVRRKLGDVDENDDDAVDFTVRLALLELTTFWSATLTEGGLSYIAGVERDLAEEAQARRQANQIVQLALEDLVDIDERWSESTWDESEDGSY